MAYKDPYDERNKAARRKHYHANKEQYLERNRAARKAQKEWLRDQKSRPCTDCGVEYPYYVMDFDHRDPSEKEFNLSSGVSHIGSWKRLRAEIEKCDVVCANCHRERTWGNHAS